MHGVFWIMVTNRFTVCSYKIGEIQWDENSLTAIALVRPVSTVIVTVTDITCWNIAARVRAPELIIMTCYSYNQRTCWCCYAVMNLMMHTTRNLQSQGKWQTGRNRSRHAEDLALVLENSNADIPITGSNSSSILWYRWRINPMGIVNIRPIRNHIPLTYCDKIWHKFTRRTYCISQHCRNR